MQPLFFDNNKKNMKVQEIASQIRQTAEQNNETILSVCKKAIKGKLSYINSYLRNSGINPSPKAFTAAGLAGERILKEVNPADLEIILNSSPGNLPMSFKNYSFYSFLQKSPSAFYCSLFIASQLDRAESYDPDFIDPATAAIIGGAMGVDPQTSAMIGGAIGSGSGSGGGLPTKEQLIQTGTNYAQQLAANQAAGQQSSGIIGDLQKELSKFQSDYYKKADGSLDYKLLIPFYGLIKTAKIALERLGPGDNGKDFKIDGKPPGVINFYKYFPGQELYRQPLRRERMSVGYLKGTIAPQIMNGPNGAGAAGFKDYIEVDAAFEMFGEKLTQDARYNSNWAAFWKKLFELWTGAATLASIEASKQTKPTTTKPTQQNNIMSNTTTTTNVKPFTGGSGSVRVGGKEIFGAEVGTERAQIFMVLGAAVLVVVLILLIKK